MKYISLLLILLFPLLLHAQEASDRKVVRVTKDSLKRRIYLGDPWKFKAGDNIAWASPELNDSSWIETKTYIDIEKGEDKKLGFKGQGWFRKHFLSDSALVEIPIALGMQLDGATDIYVDGKLVKQYGSFRKNGDAYYEDPKYEVAVLLLKPGEHVLAVRYENFNAWNRLAKYNESETGFRMWFTNTTVGVESIRGTLFTVSLITLISGSIFLTLFIVHLILFLFYRATVSNLIFSLFNFGFASFFYLMYIGFVGQSIAFQDTSTLLVNIALSVSCFSLSALVNNLFNKKKLRFRIITMLCIAVVVVTFINYTLAANMLAGVGIICALEAAILVCRAMYRKVRGAKILGIGILFFVLFFASIIIASLVLNGIHLEGGPIALLLIILAVMAIFSIPFSMSAYLAWSFASVSKNLKAQLHQVEILSQKTIEQEQEKQQLLESRKEELEKEVAVRTTEVMRQKAKIEQQHEDLKAEKKKSDDLLLNILPAEVAEELKETGTTKAQHFDHVTVLFTDFVNFTQISEQLSPEQLVQELHECFRAFDDIMERNGLEKIKTIGDAYLAVSGMPVANERHAYNAVKAGLEIVEFIRNRSLNKHSFEVRVGINSGELVAGIVGVKKFAYDIWGDTVNMASRMESNSEAGRVNISENTHELVLNDFTFTYRGKVNAKNKGEVDMYFVDDVIGHND
ncbi:MAG: adenylate/guanylate cyclase domain-containing protein [Taibaiella sp.]|jgi:class 3 adenylate cyclase